MPNTSHYDAWYKGYKMVYTGGEPMTVEDKINALEEDAKTNKEQIKKAKRLKKLSREWPEIVELIDLKKKFGV
jgi:hypothetical protein